MVVNKLGGLFRRGRRQFRRLQYFRHKLVRQVAGSVFRLGVLTHTRSLDRRENKKLFGLPIHAEQQIQVLLVPYGTPACKMQHAWVSEVLRAQGVFVSVKSHSELFPEQGDPFDSSHESAQLGNFREVIDSLVSQFPSDFHMQRGIIDEFIRKAPVTQLTQLFAIPDGLIAQAWEFRAAALVLLSGFDVLVLADSAYLKNRVLLSAARELGKSAWVLNPKGQFIQINDSQDEDSSDSGLQEARSAVETDPDLVHSAENYLQNRVEGLTSGDSDARLAFGTGTDGVVGVRKVLFLHAIRDANQLSLRSGADEMLFSTYLEWADYVLQLVSQEPDLWWIKPHPAGFSFPDEPEILRFLFDKHRIPQEIVRPDLETRLVLARKMPVYTHSGTVALEAAAFGRKAYVCSGHLPTSIAVVAKKVSELPCHYLGSLEDKEIEIKDQGAVKLAKVLLYQKFRRRAVAISPAVAVPDKKSKDRFETSLDRQAFQMAQRVHGEVGRRSAESIANEIALSVGKSDGPK